MDDPTTTLWGDSSSRLASSVSGERLILPDGGSTPPEGRHEHPSAYRHFALSLAEVLDLEALRSSKVLKVLDIPRAATCRALAKRSRNLAARFEAQEGTAPTYANRQALLYDYFDLIRLARRLARPEEP